MITIKNSKGEICDYRIPYNINIKEEVDNIQKLIDSKGQIMMLPIKIKEEDYKLIIPIVMPDTKRVIGIIDENGKFISFLK